MKTYTVFFKRRAGSPISYISGAKAKGNYTELEKEHFSVEGRTFPIPVVKGSHFRGRLRQFTAEKILEKKAERIESLHESLKGKILKLVSLCYFIGNVQENEGISSVEVVEQLTEADAFFRYFGYMVSNLPAVRSRMSMGFAVPAVRGIIDDETAQAAEDLKLSVIDSGELSTVEVEVPGVRSLISLPLIDVETYRVSPKLDKVEKIGSLIHTDTKEVRDIVESYVKGSKKSSEEKDKVDVQNILFAEVMSPACDLVQKITFLDDEEELHRGILGLYLALFEREPFVGGRVSAGYGLVDNIIILDEEGNKIEKNEEAVNSFTDAINLEKVAQLIAPKRKEKNGSKKEK